MFRNPENRPDNVLYIPSAADVTAILNPSFVNLVDIIHCAFGSIIFCKALQFAGLQTCPASLLGRKISADFTYHFTLTHQGLVFFPAKDTGCKYQVGKVTCMSEKDW